MPTPATDTPGADTAPGFFPELLLLDAVIAITAYRRELQKAGYPFKEPPKVSVTLHAIEEYCAPPDLRTIRRRENK